MVSVLVCWSNLNLGKNVWFTRPKSTYSSVDGLFVSSISKPTNWPVSLVIVLPKEPEYFNLDLPS